MRKNKGSLISEFHFIPLPPHRVDIMSADTEIEIFFRVTKEYRIWVDEEGIGRIRILKNVNLKTLMDLV
ncbi:MAG: hypothetical protein ACE5KE_15915 [Methanosarcinales archaeon]